MPFLAVVSAVTVSVPVSSLVPVPVRPGIPVAVVMIGMISPDPGMRIMTAVWRFVITTGAPFRMAVIIVPMMTLVIISVIIAVDVITAARRIRVDMALVSAGMMVILISAVVVLPIRRCGKRREGEEQ
jgi:hypothetical protein